MDLHRSLPDVEMCESFTEIIGEEIGRPDSHIFRLGNGIVRYVHTLTVCPNGCEIPQPKEKAKPE